ncbi:MAG: GNAT family N-acetyltransferase [Chloroflexi bacterium]|nr:GNAT family N-acetyltransferase [Chloroflexota bacterium]
MLSFELATPEQRDEFLCMMRTEMSDYIEQTLALMHMTWERFVELYQSRGSVFAVYQDGALAGYSWIEIAEQILHLHGIILLPEFRGHGIGTQILRELAREHASQVKAIELGVKDENTRARRLYEREGFQVVKSLRDAGFTVMQKSVSAE